MSCPRALWQGEDWTTNLWVTAFPLSHRKVCKDKLNSNQLFFRLKKRIRRIAKHFYLKKSPVSKTQPLENICPLVALVSLSKVIMCLFFLCIFLQQQTLIWAQTCPCRTVDKHPCIICWHTMPSEFTNPTCTSCTHKQAHVHTLKQSCEANNHLASVSPDCVIYTLRQKAETLAWRCTVCCSNQGLHLLFMDRNYQLLSTSTWTIVISWQRRRGPTSERFILTQEKQAMFPSGTKSMVKKCSSPNLKYNIFGFDVFIKCTKCMANHIEERWQWQKSYCVVVFDCLGFSNHS